MIKLLIPACLAFWPGLREGLLVTQRAALPGTWRATSCPAARARDFLEAKAKARAARCLVDSLVERAKVSLEKMDCLEKEARERDFSERTAFLEEGGRKEAKENLQNLLFKSIQTIWNLINFVFSVC